MQDPRVTGPQMRLLLVEDDRAVRITVRDALTRGGFEVTSCEDGVSAIRVAESKPFDVVLTDVRMPGCSGLELLKQLHRTQPATAVVVMTAFATTDDAVTVMREGARDYIAKPFEMDELFLRLGRVCDEHTSRRELEAGVVRPARGHQIDGSSPAIRLVLERLASAASMDVGVVITGETGTGKDLCARTIHERSRRAGKPFIAVNCAAIPEQLVEAEFFGHERGAFTGADRKRIGRFQAAHGGTLFLDELGELPLAQQAKVLRAIDTKSFEPLGSSSSVHADVRVIAATNIDLAEAVDRKQFRKDLYYRLNVIDIRMPPLRDRRADIPKLAAELLDEVCARHGRSPKTLDPRTLALLSVHDYPGNVRELIHALEHAVALSAGDVVPPEHLPRAFWQGVNEVPNEVGQALAAVMSQFELQYIRHVLNQVDGHRGRAASLLGISRKALWQKLRTI